MQHADLLLVPVHALVTRLVPVLEPGQLELVLVLVLELPAQ